MNDALLQQEFDHSANHTSYIHGLFDKAEEILQQHRQDNPDLYRKVKEQKIIKEINKKKSLAAVTMTYQEEDKAIAPQLIESIYFKQFKQKELKEKIETNYQHIHGHHIATQSLIVPRTQARNVKQMHCSVEEMISDRENKLSSQIQAWRSVLPNLINRFAKIPDPRRAKSIKHKLSIVLLYGLFAFIFRLSSRREINRELSGTIIFEIYKKYFPSWNRFHMPIR
jgi:hypothetical protein